MARSLGLGVLPLAVVGVLFLADPSAGAAGRLTAVRTLAESVLGDGVVTAVAVSEDGSQVSMRWETVTYGSGHTVAIARELVYAEAQLTTGSVMTHLDDVVQIRFTILKKGRMLATGQNRRGRGVELMFSSQLGGGVAVPGSTTPKPDRLQGGEAAREQ